MLNNASGFDHVYLAVGYTDLRRGIDGLVDIIRESFHLDPYENSLFLFCGRRSDRIKAIVWEGDGYLLCYKRLETGRFQWPRTGPVRSAAIHSSPYGLRRVHDGSVYK